MRVVHFTTPALNLLTKKACLIVYSALFCLLISGDHQCRDASSSTLQARRQVKGQDVYLPQTAHRTPGCLAPITVRLEDALVVISEESTVLRPSHLERDDCRVQTMHANGCEWWRPSESQSSWSAHHSHGMMEANHFSIVTM